MLCAGGHARATVGRTMLSNCAVQHRHLVVQDAAGHTFATRLHNVFIIGKGPTPLISLPASKGIRLSIAEERDRRLAQKQKACQSRSTKIVVNALDSLEKLISYGHLLGNLPDRVVQTICSPFQGPHTDDSIQLQIIKGILALILNNNCKIHEGSLLLAVRTCFNIYLASRSAVNQSTAKGILTQTINFVFANMERVVDNPTGEVGGHGWENSVVRDVVDSLVYQVCTSSEYEKHKERKHELARSRHTSADERLEELSVNGLCSPSTTPNSSAYSFHQTTATVADDGHSSGVGGGHNTPLQPSKLEFHSLEEKDAFLIFRALCKLSIKQTPDDQDPRVGSFEALDIFVQLVDKYKAISGYDHATKCFDFQIHLKKQIEVFFKEIIISILDSGSSSFEHKWVVLSTMAKIFDSPQSVVDIYVNYDCHMTSANVFEDLVTHLAKIASSYAADLSSPSHGQIALKERERRMRELALDCLVKVLQCLVFWYEEMNLGKDQSIHGGDETANTAFASNNCSGSDVNLTAQAKQQKGIVESGIDLFAKKPKQGLKFLHEKGFVGAEPVDIAKFFHAEERLDKSIIGDYLGDGDEFNQLVMYSYVDTFDFSAVNIVQALRTLLSKFRLPGEAQKIDRIMEKFASRYCACNPQLSHIFASADTAYVLSYSVIMLTTDLHNPQVKRKMTKEEYIRMNRGINDQSDLPDDFLSQIYDDIATNEIKTKPGNLKRPKLNSSTATIRQRKMFQNLELESISEVAHTLMEAATYCNLEFTSASNFEQVQLMFELIWSPCLATFSIGLQSSEEPQIWDRCLQGFSAGISVACLFRLGIQRKAFVQTLTKFTLLTANSSLSEIRPKNVESIKLLIHIGVENGSYLDQSWYDVLKCISQLELVHSIGTGNHENLKSMFNIRDKSFSTVQGYLAETSSQDLVVAIDRIFQNSSKLSGEAVIQFVRALCQVLLEELCSPGGPSMYMLQKIVEISFYNMNRIRIEWSMIWSVLGEHFNLAGCSSNQDISHFALDALRQLSMKFLEKGELPNFRFQKEFLHPFEVIMSRNKSLSCREMIVSCVTHMVHSHADKIRSGWKNIFSLFTMAAGEKDERIVEAAFTTTAEIITNIFPSHFTELMDSFQEAIKCHSFDPFVRLNGSCVTHMVHSHADKIRSGWKNIFSLFTMAAGEKDERIVEAAFTTTAEIITNIFPSHFTELMDSFQEAIKCLSEFACNIVFPDTSMEAIRLIRLSASMVAEHADLINVRCATTTEATSGGSPAVEQHRPSLSERHSRREGQPVWLVGWFPIIFELSCIINRCKLDVRTRSLTVLFELIKTYGGTFGVDAWSDLFRIIFRIFDFGKISELGNELFNEAKMFVINVRVNAKQALDDRLRNVHKVGREGPTCGNKKILLF
uniref:SEC7 domain-containing protein n=1 Tax=Globodera pallida TaxID=36090 RepID=A0A183C0R6_GLOPA